MSPRSLLRAAGACLAALFALALPGPPALATSAHEHTVDSGGQAAAPLVEIYTTPSCPYCKALRKYLHARGIEYIEHNISASQQTREAFYATGAHGVPVTVIGGQRIHGFNPLRIESALRKARALADGD